MEDVGRRTCVSVRKGNRVEKDYHYGNSAAAPIHQQLTMEGKGAR